MTIICFPIWADLRIFKCLRLSSDSRIVMKERKSSASTVYYKLLDSKYNRYTTFHLRTSSHSYWSTLVPKGMPGFENKTLCRLNYFAQVGGTYLHRVTWSYYIWKFLAPSHHVRLARFPPRPPPSERQVSQAQFFGAWSISKHARWYYIFSNISAFNYFINCCK